MNNFTEMVKNIISGISIEKIIWIAILAIILVVICRTLTRVASRLFTRSKMTDGLNRFLTQIVKFVLYFITILIVCDAIGIPVTSLLALFSLFGLAISLSVQGLLGNLMSGFSILMFKPFDVGDYIETDIGGKVQNVGLFYTELMTYDNRKVYIPNDKIMEGKLINYDSQKTRRIDVMFPAGFEYDTEDVISALHEAVDSVPALLKAPEPFIAIDNYGERAIYYSVLVWTDTPNYFTAKAALMDAVSASYKRHGIKAYSKYAVEINDKN